MGNYLRRRLGPEGVRSRTPPPRLTKLAAGGLLGGETDTFTGGVRTPIYSWKAQASCSWSMSGGESDPGS